MWRNIQLNPTSASNSTVTVFKNVLWFADQLSNTRGQHNPTVQDRSELGQISVIFKLYYSEIMCWSGVGLS